LVKQLLNKNNVVTPKIISVEALEKYNLKLRFDDGTEGVYESVTWLVTGFLKLGMLTTISLKFL